MKYILSLLITVLCCTPLFAEEMTGKELVQKYRIDKTQLLSNQLTDAEILIQIEDHEVRLFSFGRGVSVCTGTIIKNDENGADILTVKHCVSVMENTYADNVEVKRIKVSVNDDIALMSTDEPIPYKKAAKLGWRDSRRNEKVYGFGYGASFPMHYFGNLLITDKEDYYVRMNVIGGCSGSGIFNEYGELVGVLWGVIPGFEMSIYEPLADVNKFLASIGYKFKKGDK